MSFYPSHVTLAQVDARPGEATSPAATGQPAAGDASGTLIGQPANGSQPAPTTQPGFSTSMMIGFFILIFLVMIILPQRREKKKQAQMQSSLKKGDRVQTIGGIRGSIAEIHDGEIVLKVDESNNTRVTFARSAVQGVVEGSKND